jgi:hypothetical protein
MHLQIKLIVPLGLLFFFGCIDVPAVDDAPPADAGHQPETPQPDFKLAVAPNRVTITQGQGQTVQLTLTREGSFSGSVSVSAVNPPAGVTVAPFAVDSGITVAAVSVSVAESAEVGPKTLTLRGTAGTLVREVTVEVTVQKPAGYALSVEPDEVSIIQGQSQTLQLSLTREGGFSDSVSVSAVNPPAGVTVQPATIAAGSTTAAVDVAVASDAEVGLKVLTLRGTAGTLVREVTVAVTVQKPAGYVLAVVPDKVSIIQGQSQTLQLSLTREGGFSDSVSVTAVNPPAGVTVQPATIGAGSTTAAVDVAVAGDAEVGLKTLMLRGTAGTLVREVTVAVTVQKPAGYVLAVAPDKVSIIQGQSQTLQLSLTREGGFSDSVSVSAVNPPAGVTVQPATIGAGSTTAAVDVAVAESAAVGPKTLTLRGTAGTLLREVTVEVTVVKRPDFTLSASPNKVSITQRQSQRLQLSLTREGGFSQSVSVSAVNPPTGISVQPTTIAAGGTTAAVDVAVSEDAQPGVTVLTLRGTAGSLVRETTVEVTVVKLPDLVVTWVSPAEDKVSTRGTLALQVSVQQGTADYVELLKGPLVLAKLTAAPYEYNWDTRQVQDGEVTLSARAVRGTKAFTSTTTKTVVIDNTAPTLVSRSPGPGAPHVSIHENIRVVFSEPLKPSTVKDSSVVLTVGGANVTKTLSLSADGKTLTVDPVASLPIQSSVTFKLGTATEPLTDAVGNPLTESTSWSFTVPAWLPLGGAISAVAGNTPAEDVAMKVGSDGKPVIAWSEFDGSVKNVYVRRWNGTTWEPMGSALNSLPGTDTDTKNPSLATDGAGQIVVMWDEVTGTSTYGKLRNLFGRKWNGAGWSLLPGMPIPPSHNGYDELFKPSAIFDGQGRLIVAADANVFEVGSRSKAFWLNSTQDGWSYTADPGTADTAHRWNIALVMDTGGSVIAAYQGYQLAEPVSYGAILVQRLGADWTWSLIGSPIPSETALGGVSIVTDATGIPLVGWVDTSSNGTDTWVFVAQWSSASKSWVMLGDAAAGRSTANSKASLAVGSDGKALVAWSGVAASERSIWVARREGNAWQLVGSPLSALSTGNTAASNPVLAIDSAGYPLVAWHESDGTASNVSNIYVYRYNY